jgi:hypothetical protein
VVIGKQKTLNGMFTHINKKDMEVIIKCDFVALNVKLEFGSFHKERSCKKTNGVAQEAN